MKECAILLVGEEEGEEEGMAVFPHLRTWKVLEVTHLIHQHALCRTRNILVTSVIIVCCLKETF